MVAPRLELPALSGNLDAGYAVALVFMVVQVRSVAKDVCEDMLLV